MRVVLEINKVMKDMIMRWQQGEGYKKTYGPCIITMR